MYFQIGTDLENFVKTKQLQRSSSIQPYMIWIKGDHQHFYVVADNTVIHRADKSDLTATFDLLFKMFFVFDLQYPVRLRNFFYFVENYIYKISKKSAPSMVTSLHVNLESLDINKNIDSEVSD